MKFRCGVRLRLLICFCLAHAAGWSAQADIATASSYPVVDLIRVYKKERKLEVLSSGRVLRSFSVALGKDPIGHKVREGDGRTPEGKYLLDFRKADSAFYKAFHISYPNAQDTAQARARQVSPGGQIMVHGQKNGFGWLSPIMQRFDWTNGCIGLSNEDMDVLWSLLKDGTPIEIFP